MKKIKEFSLNFLYCNLPLLPYSEPLLEVCLTTVVSVWILTYHGLYQHYGGWTPHTLGLGHVFCFMLSAIIVLAVYSSLVIKICQQFIGILFPKELN